MVVYGNRGPTHCHNLCTQQALFDDEGNGYNEFTQEQRNFNAVTTFECEGWQYYNGTCHLGRFHKSPAEACIQDIERDLPHMNLGDDVGPKK
jgi:hypothetical protein